MKWLSFIVFFYIFHSIQFQKYENLFTFSLPKEKVLFPKNFILILPICMLGPIDCEHIRTPIKNLCVIWILSHFITIWICLLEVKLEWLDHNLILLILIFSTFGIRSILFFIPIAIPMDRLGFFYFYFLKC